jgi:very-short-patch-repair endonuclease
MGTTLQDFSRAIWRLSRNQHGAITRHQLLDFGVTSKEIERRVARGRLHPIHRGVYAVGRPELTQHGLWMAAVLSCGPAAVLSHGSAAALWAIRARRERDPGSLAGSSVEISVPAEVDRRRRGIRLHRRCLGKRDVTRRDGIPVTTPSLTLIDLGTVLIAERLEAVVNEADKLGLVDPERLRREVEEHAGVAGVAALRSVLDHRTFRLTDSELERRFLRLVRRAKLPPPRTRERLNGFRVDFYWPELGLVVETDGLRYHRTPAQQARDRLRDQAHLRAGLVAVRFTHAQVAFEPAHVVVVLRDVAARRRLERLAGAG